MKKLSVLLLAMVLTLTLTGCGKKVTSSTCTIKQNGSENTFKLTATNDQIDKVDLTMVIDNSMLGVKDLSNLTDEQKDLVKTNMLKSLGLEDGKTEGFEIDVKIEKEMTITVKADLKKADSAVLRKIGMNITGADMSLEKTVKDMKDNGATCK